MELQLRTRIQHAWATAVETVGTFLQQSLKSSEGHEQWLRFFELVGSGFALNEGTPIAPNVPDNTSTLISEIREFSKQLQVRTTLRGFGRALQVIEENEAMREHNYFLLSLRPVDELLKLKIWAYARTALDEATKHYDKVEQESDSSTGETVLVSADSLEALKRAYPNYFLDTQTFVAAMDALLE